MTKRIVIIGFLEVGKFSEDDIYVILRKEKDIIAEALSLEPFKYSGGIVASRTNRVYTEKPYIASNMANANGDERVATTNTNYQRFIETLVSENNGEIVWRLAEEGAEISRVLREIRGLTHIVR